MNIEPYVSIAMISYNHEKYIDESIESVLSQDLDFSYEIIIGDDSSTDSTLEHLKRFASTNHNIQIVERINNIGATANLGDIISRCKGKYVAILEGDDYWTYEEKLKEQIYFLDNNQEFFACYHKVCTVDSSSYVIDNEVAGIGLDGPEYTWHDVAKLKLPGQTGTVVFRNQLCKADIDIMVSTDRMLGDRSLAIVLLNKGRVKVINQVWSAYRVVISDSGTNYSSIVHNKNELFHAYEIYSKLSSFHCEAKEEIIDAFEYAKARILFSAFVRAIKKPNKENRLVIRNIMKIKSKSTFKYSSLILLNHWINKK